MARGGCVVDGRMGDGGLQRWGCWRWAMLRQEGENVGALRVIDACGTGERVLRNCTASHFALNCAPCGAKCASVLLSRAKASSTPPPPAAGTTPSSPCQFSDGISTSQPRYSESGRLRLSSIRSLSRTGPPHPQHRKSSETKGGCDSLLHSLTYKADLIEHSGGTHAMHVHAFHKRIGAKSKASKCWENVYVYIRHD